MPTSTTAAYDEATAWLYDRINYEKLAKPGTRYRFTLDRMRDLIRRMGHGNRLAEPRSLAAETDSKPVSPVIAGATVIADGGVPAAAFTAPKIVHIAGTKGKGSVATMTAAMLTAAGYRVGLYTSPHLVDLEERFRVDGQSVGRSTLVELLESLRPLVETMTREEIGGPSFFELTTAIAVEHFHRARCDFWVLETGLGGRLDSTNVFQSDVTVITSIGLDHQHVLGNTLEEIAGEKAGILKPGVPAVSGVIESPAREVILTTAEKVRCPISEFKQDFDIHPTHPRSHMPPQAWGADFEFFRLGQPPSESAIHRARLAGHLSLEGEHQIRNAALAIETLHQIEILHQLEPLHRGNTPVETVSPKFLTAEAIEPLARIQIAARLERFELRDHGTLILDAAHNPDSIAALIATVRRRFADRTIVGVFGTSMDKDAAVMLRQLRGCFSKIVLTRYHGNPRFVPIESLEQIVQAIDSGPTTSPAESDRQRSSDSQSWSQSRVDPIDACRRGIELAGRGGVTVVCGSFFLAAEVRPWLSEVALQE